MQSLRSVITQGTRGGRWVASRRSYSSSFPREGASSKVEEIASAEETNGPSGRARRWSLCYKAVSYTYIACSSALLYRYFVYFKSELDKAKEKELVKTK